MEMIGTIHTFGLLLFIENRDLFLEQNHFDISHLNSALD